MDGEAARSPGERSTPVNCGSRSDACPNRCIDGDEGGAQFASTLALTLGSLAIPAAALADGLIDPNFNGTGYAVGPAFSGQDNRVPMVIEPDGKIVVGGSAGGAMTLIRYNLDGSVDSTFGNGGVAQRQITGTPNGAPGLSGATAMTLDTNGTILVAGFGGSQSMFVARYSAAGTFINSVVCFAPHLIDYSARALAVKPNGQVVLVGYAHDRHAAVLDPTQPIVTYGQRAVVTVPQTAAVPAGSSPPQNPVARTPKSPTSPRARPTSPSTACSTTARAPIPRSRGASTTP